MALAVVVALVVVGLVVYNLMPADTLTDEEFRKLCGEKNECLWLDQK